MDPLLVIFLLSLFAGYIAVYCLQVFSDWLHQQISPHLMQGRKYYSQMKESAEPWPRISSIKAHPIDRMLGWAGVRRLFLEPVWIILPYAGLLFAAGLLGGFDWVLLFVLLGLMAIIYLLFRGKQRQRSFLAGLPYALDSLNQSLKAGYSLQQAFQFVARETPSPVREVLSAVDRGLGYKVPLRECLEAIEDDLATPEWNSFAEALILQEKTGGNMIPIIASVSQTMRENFVIEQEMRTATASGRMSGMVLAGIVPLALLAFWFLNPSYLRIFMLTTVGRVLFMLAIALEIIGFLLIRKITQTQV